MDPIYNNESKTLSSIPENLRTEVVENSNSTYTQYTQIHLPAFLEKYQAYMPSRKIVIVIVMIIVVLLGYIIVPKIPTMIKSIAGIFSNKKTLPIPKNPVTSAQPDKDSDGDGVPDWQEALFNLDPNDPDSNNDGTSDTVPSDLQKLANDPNIVSPSDKIVLAVIADLQKDSKEYTQQEIAQKVTDKVMEIATQTEAQFQSYSLKDIETVDDTPENIQKYQKTMTAIQKQISLNDTAQQSIHSMVLSGELSGISITTRLAYGDTVKQLLTIPVPRMMSTQHLKVINGLSVLTQLVQKSTTDKTFISETDPYVRIIVTQKNINAVNKSLANIKLITL